jgi:hypothetical protein
MQEAWTGMQTEVGGTAPSSRDAGPKRGRDQFRGQLATCPSLALFHWWPVSGVDFHLLVGREPQKRHLQEMLRSPHGITLRSKWDVVRGAEVDPNRTNTV